jgi:hypothetical protein
MTYRLADIEKKKPSSSAPYPLSLKSYAVIPQSYDPHEKP